MEGFHAVFIFVLFCGRSRTFPTSPLTHQPLLFPLIECERGVSECVCMCGSLFSMT